MPIDRAKALAHEFPQGEGQYQPDDVILYHLGIGAGVPATGVVGSPRTRCPHSVSAEWLSHARLAHAQALGSVVPRAHRNGNGTMPSAPHAFCQCAIVGLAIFKALGAR